MPWHSNTVQNTGSLLQFSVTVSAGFTNNGAKGLSMRSDPSSAQIDGIDEIKRQARSVEVNTSGLRIMAIFDKLDSADCS